MADILNDDDSVFLDDPDLYGKKIEPVPAPSKNIGIDVDGEFYDALIQGVKNNIVDISKLESFTQVSQNREVLYEVLDGMAEDTTIAAALEIYAEDATELSENGRIVWATSNDPDVTKYITYLLDVLNVDKTVYKHAYCLCRYGDVYLHLFRQSDFEDALFKTQNEKEKKLLHESIEETEKQELDESVIVKAYAANDNYAHYMEMVPNPAEMFELVKFGKTYAYIQASVRSGIQKTTTNVDLNSWKYTFKRSDVNLYDATSFVHGCLEDNFDRFPETVDIFLDDPSDGDGGKLSYSVRRGQSLLYPVYKQWRNTMLLENSMLLNRITKSSVLRIVQVEVGDMPKENVGPHMMKIKSMIEQKAAINTGNLMTEYTNPGPMENTIYVPTHNDKGNISIQQLGGDVNVQGLADIDYFKNKLYSGLRVPKQFLGDTEDAAGFNGGTSLSLISSRYAKAVKRIQNVLIQMYTDAINLILLDNGMPAYVDKFTLRMQIPTTQEEIDRRDNKAAKIQIATDIMNLLENVEDQVQRLRILKELLSDIVDDVEVLELIQQEIDRQEETPEVEMDEADEKPKGMETIGPRNSIPSSNIRPSGNPLAELELNKQETSSEPEAEGEEGPGPAEIISTLPSPADLGIDMTDTAAMA